MSGINYKIILIGNSGVGKTSIFKKIDTGEFHDKNIMSLGVEKKTVDLDITIKKNGEEVIKHFSISLFDTAGQERFRALTLNYFKDSEGILLLYDITSRITFENVSEWVNNIKDAVNSSENSNYVVILIGNKLDLVEEGKEERVVTVEEAKSACREYNLYWGGEISTKNIKLDKLTENLKEYVEEIYYKVGEKSGGVQKTKTLYSKKKKKNFC